MYPEHPNNAQPQDAPQVPGSTAYQTIAPPQGAGYGAPTPVYQPKKKSYVGLIIAGVVVFLLLVGGIVGLVVWNNAKQEEARQRAEAARLAAEAAKPKLVSVLLNQQAKFDESTKLQLPEMPTGWRETANADGVRTIGNPATSELVMYGVVAPPTPLTCKTDYDCTRAAIDIAEQALIARPIIKEVKRTKQNLVTIKVNETKNVEFQRVQFTYTENGIAKVQEWYERVTPTMTAAIYYTRDARAPDTSSELLKKFLLKGAV